jgi:hypothetical protein
VKKLMSPGAPTNCGRPVLAACSRSSVRLHGRHKAARAALSISLQGSRLLQRACGGPRAGDHLDLCKNMRALWAIGLQLDRIASSLEPVARPATRLAIHDSTEAHVAVAARLAVNTTYMKEETELTSASRALACCRAAVVRT